MRRATWRRTTLLTAALLLAMPGGAALAESCSVGSTALVFGTYQPLTGTSRTSTATISVTCNPGLLTFINYTIRLTAGGSGQISNRAMTGSAGGSLRYQVYTDAAYSQVWGDNSAGSSDVSVNYLTLPLFPSSRSFTAYGFMSGGQSAPPGIYSDTITVMVEF